MLASVAFGILALPLAIAEETVLSSSKRGLIYVQNEKSRDDRIWENSDLTWYYNYKAEPTSGLDNSKLQFVPMLWGAGNSDANFYSTVKKLIDGGMNISSVLTFNEPDGCSNGGSCVAAETAAQIWQQQVEPLKDLGIRLGAPAVTGAPDGFNWLQNFFTECDGHCSADFIPIHWYGNFEGLASHIGQVNASYMNMTMWVTEYGYPEQSLEATQDFFNQTSTYLERLPYVTRYSYFGSFRSDVSNVGPNPAMLTQDGELTDIGAWYLDQPAEAVGNIPEGDAARVKGIASWVLLILAVSLCFLA